MDQENENLSTMDLRFICGRKKYWGKIAENADVDVMDALLLFDSVIKKGISYNAREMSTTDDILHRRVVSYARRIPVFVFEGLRLPNMRIGYTRLYDIPDEMQELQVIGKYRYAKKNSLKKLVVDRFETIFSTWRSENLCKKLLENNKPKDVLSDFYMYK